MQYYISFRCTTQGLPRWHSGKKKPPAHAEDTGDVGSFPGSRISPGGENGNPLQYSCQKNPMDRGEWRAIDHGVAKHQAQLSTHTCAT